jgi:hypothetical protein
VSFIKTLGENDMMAERAQVKLNVQIKREERLKEILSVLRRQFPSIYSNENVFM